MEDGIGIATGYANPAGIDAEEIDQHLLEDRLVPLAL